MSRNSGGDPALYFIVGALVVVLVAVFVVLSGWYPLYGERHVEVRVQTPRAELALPHAPATAAAAAAAA